MVKRLFLINVGVFLFLFILQIFQAHDLINNLILYLGQYPVLSLGKLYIWQFVTYMFIHQEPWHLLFNMMLLWFFAPELEIRWGRAGFLTFFFFAGVGGAIVEALFSLFVTKTPHVVIGASGAVMAVILASGAYFPGRRIHLWGIFPIEMKYFVGLLILIDIFGMTSGPTGVSYMTHIGGLACGYLYLTRYHRTADIARWRYMR